MKITQTRHMWIWSILVPPLLFIIWSISLIVAVNQKLEVVSCKVGLITKLNMLEKSVRELEGGITESGPGSTVDSLESRWSLLYSNYGARMEAFDLDDISVRDIRLFLIRIDSLVNQMDSHHTSILFSKFGDSRRAEAEFRAEMNRAINEVKSAVKLIRSHLASLSLDLATKWKQLNVLVLISCVLAIMVGIVLIIYQRDIWKRKRAEEALRSTQENFHNVINKSADGIIVVDRQGIVRFVNPTAECIFGRSKEAFLGEMLDFTVTPGEATEIDIRHSDRKLVIAEMRAVESEWYGRPAHIVFIHDITESRRTEEELQQSKAWLGSIFNASRDGIVVEDNEHIVYANKAFVQLYGYDKLEELLGKHVSVVQASADNEQMLEYGKRRLRGETAPSVYEFKGRRKDGSVIELEASVSVAEIAGKKHIISIIRDITERKRAEMALRQSEERFRTLTQTATDAIIGLDEKACMSIWNDAATRMFGFT
ncbi:MAG: PAS domain S-box protein, partial [bacterium]